MKNNNNCKKCDDCNPYLDRGLPCIDCYDGTNCQELYYTSCVVYNGNDLECYGVESGETLTSVITKLLELAFPNCS